MPLDYSKWDALHDDGDESPAPVRSELKSATELAPRDLQLLSLFMVRDTAQPSTSGKRDVPSACSCGASRLVSLAACPLPSTQ